MLFIRLLREDHESIEATLAEGIETIDLASRAGVPFVRVLADREPHVEGPVDDATVIPALRQLADHAASSGVTVLGNQRVYADSTRMRTLLDRVSHPAVKVLWDVHTPSGFFGRHLPAHSKCWDRTSHMYMSKIRSVTKKDASVTG
jgi:sugar phosphate isomerase/epimerase